MTNLTSDDILALQADFGTLSLAAAEAIVTLRADRNQALAFHAQACDAARVLTAERDAARLACARFLLFFRTFDGADMYAEIRHPAFDAIKAEALQAAIPVAQKEMLK